MVPALMMPAGSYLLRVRSSCIANDRYVSEAEVASYPGFAAVSTSDVGTLNRNRRSTGQVHTPDADHRPGGAGLLLQESLYEPSLIRGPRYSALGPFSSGRWAPGAPRPRGSTVSREAD